MKILSPRVHGYLDFVVVVLFAMAPTVFGFTGLPATVSYVLAGVHLTLTLLTAFPAGVVKLIPFTVHGALELLVGILLVVAPWAAGFSEQSTAKIFYVAAGVLILLVFFTTGYKAAATPGSQSHAGSR